MVFPQAPPEHRWHGKVAHLALATLDHTLREFSSDPDRVYLVGLSAGSPYPVIAQRIRSLPTGIWHGDADDVVPVAESRRMAEALRTAGAEEPDEGASAASMSGGSGIA